MKYSQANIFSDNGEDASDLKPSISVYGDLNLDEDEKEALQMDPKFAVLDPLSPEDFEVEIELCISKQKWNRMSRAGNSEDEAEREQVELEDTMSREVFDLEEKVFNMQKQRVTDLKHNAYVILPPTQEIDYESLLELRRQKQSQIFRDYVKQNCDKKGRQKTNITKQQARGLKKLRKRIEEGKLIVCQTDKSGRLCVMPMEMYMEAGEVHSAGDMEVDKEFVHNTQRRLNGNVSMWIKCLDMGADWKHQNRLRETQDHKRARAACAAISEAVADNMKKKDEVISTDDALSRIDSYNLKQSQSMQCRDEFEPEESHRDTSAEFVFVDVLDKVLGDNWEKEPGREYHTDEEEFNEEEEELDKLYEDKTRQEEETIVVGSLFPSVTAEQRGSCVEKLCWRLTLNLRE